MSSNHLQNSSGLINNNQMMQSYQNNLYASGTVAATSLIPPNQHIYHHHIIVPPTQQYHQHQQHQAYPSQPQQQQHPQQIISQHNYLHHQQQQQQQKPNSLNIYYTLLGLAEKFRQTSNYRLVIHCLESILTIKPAIETNLIIDVHFNLCKYYLKYTTNSLNIINGHLEKAVRKSFIIFQEILFFYLKLKISGDFSPLFESQR